MLIGEAVLGRVAGAASAFKAIRSSDQLNGDFA
jgi:hypothetical protein